jgi:hypothetical protein
VLKNEASSSGHVWTGVGTVLVGSSRLANQAADGGLGPFTDANGIFDALASMLLSKELIAERDRPGSGAEASTSDGGHSSSGGSSSSGGQETAVAGSESSSADKISSSNSSGGGSGSGGLDSVRFFERVECEDVPSWRAVLNQSSMGGGAGGEGKLRLYLPQLHMQEDRIGAKLRAILDYQTSRHRVPAGESRLGAAPARASSPSSPAATASNTSSGSSGSSRKHGAKSSYGGGSSSSSSGSGSKGRNSSTHLSPSYDDSDDDAGEETEPLPPWDEISIEEAERIAERVIRREEAAGRDLSKEQREALRQAAVSPVTILTGGPGTGKTFITGLIYEMWRDDFGLGKVSR